MTDSMHCDILNVQKIIKGLGAIIVRMHMESLCDNCERCGSIDGKNNWLHVQITHCQLM